MRILIAEPSQEVVDSISAYTKLLGLEAKVAENFEVLKSCLQDETFDFVATSIPLPGAPETEDYTRWLRQQPGSAEASILALIEDDDGRSASQLFHLDNTEVLYKSRLDLFMDCMAALLPVYQSGQHLPAQILILEDDEDVRAILGLTLESAGLHPTFATTVSEAMVVLDQKAIEVIVTDYYLEDHETGIDLIKKLRADRRWKTIPILMLTSNQDREQRLNSLRYGAQDVLEKQMGSDELILRIRSLLTTRLIFKQLEREREKLRLISTVDSLTGLKNRAVLVDGADRYLSKARRHDFCVALLLVDLDHFKKVNDNYGHQTGDEVLRQVGSLMRSAVRKEDLAARLGGEEFALLLSHCNGEQAANKAEIVRDLVEKLHPANLKVTCSIGVRATKIGEDVTFDTIYEQADKALYFSKHNGRNQVTDYLEWSNTKSEPPG